MQFKLGICQMQVVDDKIRNLRRAAEWVHRAAGEGAQVVMLPEMFCCPYQNAYFVRYAEPFGERITEALREMALAEGVYLIGGSMPEAAEGKIYNTCAVLRQREIYWANTARCICLIFRLRVVWLLRNRIR